MDEQARIRRHERTFQKVLKQEKAEHEKLNRTKALKEARKAEHRGLHGRHAIESYEGKIAAKTKMLHGRMSYSPFGKKK
jgi:hypothetical protein